MAGDRLGRALYTLPGSAGFISIIRKDPDRLAWLDFSWARVAINAAFRDPESFQCQAVVVHSYSYNLIVVIHLSLRKLINRKDIIARMSGTIKAICYDLDKKPVYRL